MHKFTSGFVEKFPFSATSVSLWFFFLNFLAVGISFMFAMWIVGIQDVSKSDSALKDHIHTYRMVYITLSIFPQETISADVSDGNFMVSYTFRDRILVCMRLIHSSRRIY